MEKAEGNQVGQSAETADQVKVRIREFAKEHKLLVVSADVLEAHIAH